MMMKLKKVTVLNSLSLSVAPKTQANKQEHQWAESLIYSISSYTYLDADDWPDERPM